MKMNRIIENRKLEGSKDTKEMGSQSLPLSQKKNGKGL
jgi:hypothetical protein